MLKKCLPLLLLCTAPVFAKPVLTVYTYDSFAADWGPGPVVKKAFEADCNCELKLVALEMAFRFSTVYGWKAKPAKPM